MIFTSLDARILYAIYQPKQKIEEVRFRYIIAFSDYVDHSILTYEEFSACLGKLAQAGLVVISLSTVRATPNYKKWLIASYKTKKPVSIHPKMREINTYLNTTFAELLPAEEKKELPTKEEFEKAVDEYLGSARLDKTI